MSTNELIAILGFLTSILGSVAAIWRNLERRITEIEHKITEIEHQLAVVSRWFQDPGPENNWVPLPTRLRMLEDRLASVESRL